MTAPLTIITPRTPTRAALAAMSCSEVFAYELTNGKIVHPRCREDYQRKFKAGKFPAIESAWLRGHDISTFATCDHCQNSII